MSDSGSIILVKCKDKEAKEEKDVDVKALPSAALAFALTRQLEAIIDSLLDLTPLAEIPVKFFKWSVTRKGDNFNSSFSKSSYLSRRSDIGYTFINLESQHELFFNAYKKEVTTSTLDAPELILLEQHLAVIYNAFHREDKPLPGKCTTRQRLLQLKNSLIPFLAKLKEEVPFGNWVPIAFAKNWIAARSGNTVRFTHVETKTALCIDSDLSVEACSLNDAELAALTKELVGMGYLERPTSARQGITSVMPWTFFSRSSE